LPIKIYFNYLNIQVKLGILNDTIRTQVNTNQENDWFYLLIQSLYEYIDSKFWSSFPWTTKAKQRHQLQSILGDLLSLTTNDITKTKKFIEKYKF
jgi:hypothetical protein